MKVFFISSLIITCLFACKNRKKEGGEEKNIFSVVSFLQSQVKTADTSHYSFVRVQTSDGRSDTQTISKEEFRNYAKEFTHLPDISLRTEKYEVSKSYDSMLNNLVVTYLATDINEEVTRETILWEPDSQGNSQVKTIYINRVHEASDTIKEKELTWQINKGFQIITKTQVAEQPEKVDIVQVQWK